MTTQASRERCRHALPLRRALGLVAANDGVGALHPRDRRPHHGGRASRPRPGRRLAGGRIPALAGPRHHPGAVHGTRIAHFPTLPPVPWARPRTALVFTLHDLTWWRWRETASRMGRHYYAPLAAAALRRARRTRRRRYRHGARRGCRPLRPRPRHDHRRTPRRRAPRAPANLAPRSRPYVLTVGTLEPRKNLPRLVEAYKDSGLSATPDLLVVGRVGWGKWPPGMELLSGVGDSELVSIYQGAAALMLPSMYEGFGLPAVEAIQLGVPVICADIPALREVTGGRATYVDATNGEVLVDALRSARRLRAGRGRRLGGENVPWGRAVQLLLTICPRLGCRITS